MKPSTVDMVEAEFPENIKKYEPELYKTKDGYVLKLQCLCDGTYSFLSEMLMILKINNIREIEFSENLCRDKAPKKKPWMNCLFEAWGIVPEDKYCSSP